MSRQDRWSWFAARQQKPRRLKSASRTFGRGFSQSRRLHVEALEDRRMLAAFMVDSLLDNFDPGAPATDGLITLREAILAANTNSVVGDASSGSGADTIDFSVTGTINLAFGELKTTDSLTINGPGASQLTIDAGGSSRIFNIDDGSNFSNDVVAISGLTLTGGNAMGEGGAIRSREGLTLSDSVVTGNTASGNGGGIDARSGSNIAGTFMTSILDTVVSNNSTTGSGDGGGIFVTTSSSLTTTISGSTIVGNETSGTGGKGGGIVVSNSGTTNISLSTISGNSTNAVGGGLYLSTGASGTTTISESAIANNTAGAGIFNQGNAAGLAVSNSGITNINNSTISGNFSFGEGGGVSVFGGSGTTSIAHTTITLNTADPAVGSSDRGGGIAQSGSGTVTLDHTIVAGNSDDLSIGPDIDGSVTATFSLIGDNTGATITNNGGNQIGTGGSPIDPLLGVLSAHGGPTQTHALLVGSPAIDAGDLAILAPPANDQRGTPLLRVADGGVNGVRIDIGAYERQTVVGLSPLVVDTASDENDGDYSIGDLSLREAIGLANGSIGVDTIQFDVGLTGTTILLTLGELQIIDSVNINGLGAAGLTINADLASRIFNIDDGDNLQHIDVTLSGLTLTRGRSFTEDGGAVFSRENLSLTAVVAKINRAKRGGAIYSEGPAISILDSTISGNTAELGGGIMAANLTMRHSTVSNNTANYYPSYGGGLYVSGQTLISNSTISGNHARGLAALIGEPQIFFSRSIGGGVFGNGSATIAIAHSTITGNQAGEEIPEFGHFNNLATAGGGIFLATGGIATLTQTIVANNKRVDDDFSTELRDVDGSPGIFSAIYSIIGVETAAIVDNGGNQLGTLVAPIDPLLGMLADNGGPTQTHALLGGSPAIDSGDPSILFNATEVDQRSGPFTRVDSPGSTIDIGAYERQTLAANFFVVDTSVDENDADYSSGDVSLREAVSAANGSIGADTITFDAALSGQTITLGGTELKINEAVTIDATSLAQNVTIDANMQSRIFKITSNSGDVTLAGLTLTGGRITTNTGGAIRSSTTGSLTIAQSTISGNSTEGSSAHGGGISANGDLTLTGSTISGNSTEGNLADGGGISASGDLTLIGSTVSGNSTTGFRSDGGGIRSVRSVTLINSTVSGNSTAGDDANGGGIFSFGDITLTNSTISDNHAYYSNATGGGIWNDDDTIIITNSIIAGNTAGGGSPDIRPGTGLLSVDFSLIGDNAGTGLVEAQTAGGGGNIIGSAAGAGIINPLMGSLGDNGGPTQTHALLAGSPAIDAGDPSFTPPPNHDQRGFAYQRVVGGRIDMGAFESGATSADFDTDGDVDGADFLAWQRGFGTPNANKPDGDANGDNDVDGVDLGIWESQFGLPAPAAAASELSAVSDQPSAELIDAVMAIESTRSVDAEESSTLDEELDFAETFADPISAAEVIAPDFVFTEESDRSDTNSSEDDLAEAPWLADEMLERAFG